MRNRPLKVSYKEQTYRIPSTVNEQAAAEALSKISTLVPVYHSLERKHPDLIFWQLTTLQNGVQMIYPAFQRLPMMRNSFHSNWLRLAREKRELVWSNPHIDPVTMQIVFTVSIPFYRPEGSLIGVTAIVVPVDELLKEEPSFCTAFSQRLENPGDEFYEEERGGDNDNGPERT